MTKQQFNRIVDAATEKGIIQGSSLSWAEACELAIAYHATFRGRKTGEVHENYSSFIEIWLNEFHPGWDFKSIDGAAIKIIISRMQAYTADAKNQILVPIDKNYMDNFFRHFLKKLPDFYKNQPLNVLARRFDSIVSEIKTQNERKRITARPGEKFSDFAR